MSKPNSYYQNSKYVLIVICDLNLISLPSLIAVGLSIRIFILRNIFNIFSSHYPKPHLRIKYFIQGLRKCIDKHNKMNVINKNILLVNWFNINKFPVAVHNIYHKTGVENIWDRIIKTKSWMVARVRLILFHITKQFNLY